MDTMAGFVAARYMVSVKELEGQDDGGAAWSQLRERCQDLMALQRREHAAARLEFEKKKAEGRMQKEEGASKKAKTFNMQRSISKGRSSNTQRSTKNQLQM